MVLLDLCLSDGYGMNLMEYLANSHKYIVGIIIITGFGDADDAKRFFQLGTENIIARDFIKKPFSLTLINEKVRHTIRYIKTKRRIQSALTQDQI